MSRRTSFLGRLFAYAPKLFATRKKAALLLLLLVGVFSPLISFSLARDRQKAAAEGGARLSQLPQTSGRRPDAKQCPTCPEPSHQTIYAPTIGLAEASGSQIVFNNRSPQAKDVTPTFYGEDGKAFVGETIRLQPTEIRFVDMKKLLPAQQRGQRSWGGMSLSYTGNVLEVWAQISLLGVGGAGSTDVTFSVLDGRGSEVQEAAWWMPDGGAAVIALGNSSASPLRTTVRFPDGSQEVEIAPFATRYVRRRATVGRGASSPAGGTPDAVRLTTEGPAGSLRVVGVVTSGHRKWASSIRFYDPQAAVQPHLFATNLRLKETAPHMVLKNTGDAEVTARPRFRSTAGEDAGVVELPALTLGPQEVTEVDLGPLMESVRDKADMDSVSVQVVNSGAPGSLIGTLTVLGAATNTNYDVPLRDSGRTRNLTGSYPWRVDKDYTTVVTVTNVGDQPANFHVDVRYPGGSYYLAPRTLAVGETATFDLREMQAAQRPDHKGNKFSKAVAGGQFHWSVAPTPGDPKLVGRAEVVSRSEAVSSSYSCPVCCPDSGPYGGYNPGSTLFIDGFEARGNNGEYIDCYNYVTYSGSFNMYSQYTYDSAIATNDPSYGVGTTVTGVAAGSTYLVGEWFQQWYDNDGMDCYGRYYSVADWSPVQVTCTSPTGETIASGGWADAEGFATVHKWNQTLQPTSTSFVGRTITEENPGGGGPDTCHFSGSAVSAFTAITGGTWTVGSGNTWGPDFVGWTPSSVTYYRNQGRAPCGTSFPQRMVIDCSTGPIPYLTHTLGASIGPSTVTVQRGGQSATRAWP